MSLGQKKKFTGFVTTELVNKGSKSEHQAIIFKDDNGGPSLRLSLKGGNPFHEPAFDSFIGKRVTLEGIPTSGLAVILIENISDIVVQKPPSPRGPCFF